MKFDFTGVTTALITPFKKGEIDYSSLKKVIRHQLDNGIVGFVVSGSTAEAATLTIDEKLKLLDFVQGEISKKVPVIAGSGTFSTADSCELAKKFEKAKADGLLVVSPYYSRPPQRGLVEHYKKICQSTNLPVIAYNVPHRTASNLEVATVVSAARECPNLVGIKEAAGNLEVIESLVSTLPKTFMVLTGDDGTFVRAMHLGAQGVVSVISHVVPKLCVEAAKMSKDTGKAKTFTEELKEIVELLFCESNPIPLKWALFKMGLIETPEVRLPLVPLDEKFHKPLSEVLNRHGVL